MPRIMSRPSMGRRSSISYSSMNSLSSLGKKERLSFQRRRERISSSSRQQQQQQERYSSQSSLQRDVCSYQQQQPMMTNRGWNDMERHSTKYFESVENQKEICIIPSPTFTASTMPMNTPPSVSSFGSYYNLDGLSTPPPETTTETIIHRMQLVKNNKQRRQPNNNNNSGGSSRSTASTAIIDSSNSSLRSNDSWGQFIDVAEAEREIERHREQ